MSPDFWIGVAVGATSLAALSGLIFWLLARQASTAEPAREEPV